MTTDWMIDDCDEGWHAMHSIGWFNEVNELPMLAVDRFQQRTAWLQIGHVAPFSTQLRG
jgi:hypothetical protein